MAQGELIRVEVAHQPTSFLFSSISSLLITPPLTPVFTCEIASYRHERTIQTSLLKRHVNFPGQLESMWLSLRCGRRCEMKKISLQETAWSGELGKLLPTVL